MRMTKRSRTGARLLLGSLLAGCLGLLACGGEPAEPEPEIGTDVEAAVIAGGTSCGPLSPCPSGLVCDYGANTSCPDTKGVCVKPTTPFSCGLWASPQCGCDGVSYLNPCYRRAARTGWAHNGNCR